jgi:hypothetical protein
MNLTGSPILGLESGDDWDEVSPTDPPPEPNGEHGPDSAT